MTLLAINNQNWVISEKHLIDCPQLEKKGTWGTNEWGGAPAFHLEFSHFCRASSKRSTSIPPSSTLISSSRPSPTCPHSSSPADWPLFQRGVGPRASDPSEGIPVMMKGWRSQEEGRGSGKRVWWAEVLMWNSTSKTEFLRRQLNRRRTAPTATVRRSFHAHVRGFYKLRTSADHWSSEVCQVQFSSSASHFHGKKIKKKKQNLQWQI